MNAAASRKPAGGSACSFAPNLSSTSASSCKWFRAHRKGYTIFSAGHQQGGLSFPADLGWPFASVFGNEQAAPVAAAAAALGPDKYATVLGMSLEFYDAQRSGKLPDKRISWRGDSLTSDRTPAGTDITGGWYDAGDNVKFQLPGAWTASMLAWGLLQFRDGFQAAGRYEHGLATLRWATDFFIRSYYAPERLVGQVGNGAVDHSSWQRPEDVPGQSPVYVLDPRSPGSDVAGNIAAVLAQASIVFRQREPAYAAKCLAVARSVFDFGTKYRGKYSDSTSDAGAFYKSSNYLDDLAWAAVWLHKATGQASYLAQAKVLMAQHVAQDSRPWANIDWDNNFWTTALMLGRLGVKEYAQFPRQFVDAWLYGRNGVIFTPKGLAWHGDWGALRHTGNALFYMLSYAKDDAGLRKQILCFAQQQVAYILGERTGQSFVVGYGPNFPKQPHHRAASCRAGQQCGWAALDSAAANPNIIRGALVGGPDASDRYSDTRRNFIQNEVAIDYNAGFTGVLAALVGSTRMQC
ncbi:hypothetical protein OEZ85_010994 [Tetradesmus obliquus]|uniref:Endoglucanase n=1 Tax=Tetradesmus obliquus TaxID=3088 RepID=A0ABY8TNY7_TETOB|nr:hypothetical protein OEZ85_010994 [Tetradesmus obliquus]